MSRYFQAPPLPHYPGLSGPVGARLIHEIGLRRFFSPTKMLSCLKSRGFHANRDAQRPPPRPRCALRPELQLSFPLPGAPDQERRDEGDRAGAAGSAAVGRGVRVRRGDASLRTELQHHRDQASAGAPLDSEQRGIRDRAPDAGTVRPRPRRRAREREQRQHSDPERCHRFLLHPRVRLVLERARSLRRRSRARSDAAPDVQRRAGGSAQGTGGVPVRPQSPRWRREHRSQTAAAGQAVLVRRRVRVVRQL